MCGIVGAIGSVDCSALLLDSLKRLEYRGYDSSGIITSDEGIFGLRRSVGKIKNLEDLLKNEPLGGSVGLGHTRWATHGGVSEQNAHPHIASNRVAIVHNGIIENYTIIRSRLLSKGYKLLSETDSEVLAHLFVEAFDSGLSPSEATRNVLSQIEGTYAFAAITSDFPDIIIVARKSSPLAIGIGDEGSYIGSDAIALAHITRKVIYLKDLDYALIEVNRIRVFRPDGNEVKREPVTVSASLGLINKGGYRHFMEKEIYEQPDSIANTIGSILGDDGEISFGLSDESLKNINGIIMVAAGTSYFASLVARYWIEQIAKIPVSCELASEFHYRQPVTKGFNTALAISQSGESLDTLKAINFAKEKYLSTMALVNVVDSTIARESDFVLSTKAGPEIGVASTKAFTAQLTVLLTLGLAIAGAKNELQKEETNEILDQIKLLPGLVGKALDTFDIIRPIANELKSAKSALFLGRGHLFPIALEGALKLKELSYIHAEGFAAGEMKHGPIALIEENLPVIGLISNDNLLGKTISNLKEASARGAKIVLIADEKLAYSIDFATHVVPVPSANPLLAPIILSIPVQILAYLTALDKGTDVDQPRNLAKSVTVE